jgi:hypothetical protein
MPLRLFFQDDEKSAFTEVSLLLEVLDTRMGVDKSRLHSLTIVGRDVTH